MRVVCLSDTHELHQSLEVPAGDLLIHAGDLTWKGEPSAILEFNSWISKLPHRGKVIIAGNHDFLFQDNPAEARSLITGATYLEDSETTFEGIRIWGTPWQPWFYDWAFNLKGEGLLKQKFDMIPDGIGILVAHSPPRGILDFTERGEHVGSSALGDAILRARPKLVVFGHIHEAYGMMRRDGIAYVNACNCDAGYNPVNPPVVIDL